VLVITGGIQTRLLLVPLKQGTLIREASVYQRILVWPVEIRASVNYKIQCTQHEAHISTGQTRTRWYTDASRISVPWLKRRKYTKKRPGRYV